MCSIQMARFQDALLYNVSSENIEDYQEIIYHNASKQNAEEYEARDSYRTPMDRFYEYWSGGDPGIQSRFLVQSIVPTIFIISSYIMFVKVVGPNIMKNRKPLQLKNMKLIYNFGLVIFYLYFLSRGAFFIPELRFSFICGSLHSFQSPIVPDIFALLYRYYIIRYIELFDTIFMVLGKKYHMISNLHVFHHSIVPIFIWFGVRSETSGYLSVFMGVNCVVHIIMYTYYSIAALGPDYQKYIWWKKYLTTLQIAQFAVMCIYVNVMHLIGCTTSRFTFAFCTLLIIAFFFLFLNYYRQAYLLKGKRGSMQKAVRFQHNEVGSEDVVVKKGSPISYKMATKKD